MIFKIIRCPSKLFQLIFTYVDIEIKSVIFEKRTEEGEEHYRRMIWNEHTVMDDGFKIEFTIWKGASLTVDLKEQTFFYVPPVPEPEENIQSECEDGDEIKQNEEYIKTQDDTKKEQEDLKEKHIETNQNQPKL